jgi:predicted enzyme related to lactoylglutathione lyase
LTAHRSIELGQVERHSCIREVMTDPNVEISDIIIDCADPERLAEFWSGLLERPVKGQKGPYVWLTRSAGGMGLGFQQVKEPKRIKNRVHIDISGPDIAGIKDRVEELGGRWLDGYEDGGFLVMADPEGNEFCVVPEDFSFDASGRTDYLDRLNLGGP